RQPALEVIRQARPAGCTLPAEAWRTAAAMRARPSVRPDAGQDHVVRRLSRGRCKSFRILIPVTTTLVPTEVPTYSCRCFDRRAVGSARSVGRFRTPDAPATSPPT